MNDLFDIPESQPPRLEQLRKELAEAEAEYAEASGYEDVGEPMPEQVRARLERARAAVLREEQRLVGRGD